MLVACMAGHVDAATLLCHRGAEVDRAMPDGRTPLYSASACGRVAAARLCLDHGADVDRAMRDGATPLLAACGYNHVDVAALLLARGAGIDRAQQMARRRCGGLVRMATPTRCGSYSTAAQL